MVAFAAALPAEPDPVDPLVGKWFWYKDRLATFKADGTASREEGGMHGTWEYLQNPQVQRHYRVVWADGRYIDDVVLAEDNQRAHVHGKDSQYNVRRSSDGKSADSKSFGNYFGTPKP